MTLTKSLVATIVASAIAVPAMAITHTGTETTPALKAPLVYQSTACDNRVVDSTVIGPGHNVIGQDNEVLATTGSSSVFGSLNNVTARSADSNVYGDG